MVPAVALNTTSVPVPACNITALQRNVGLDGAREREGRWASHALAQLNKDEVLLRTITLAAYHSVISRKRTFCLLYEKEDIPAMIKFGMDVINQVTTFLNLGQVPIITVDQPMFALAKVIQ